MFLYNFIICYEVKNRYDFTKKRNVKTLIQQVKEGWDGHTWYDNDLGNRVHKPVTADLCKKFINHCIKELENWIKNSGEQGSKYHPSNFTELKSINITLHCAFKEFESYGMRNFLH